MKKKLLLRKNTVRNLTTPDLKLAIGGQEAAVQGTIWPECPTSHSFAVSGEKG